MRDHVQTAMIQAHCCPARTPDPVSKCVNTRKKGRLNRQAKKPSKEGHEVRQGDLSSAIREGKGKGVLLNQSDRLGWGGGEVQGAGDHVDSGGCAGGPQVGVAPTPPKSHHLPAAGDGTCCHCIPLSLYLHLQDPKVSDTGLYQAAYSRMHHISLHACICT